MPGAPGGAPVLLYDGECGLCDGFVRAVAERDGGAFRFAPLQSEVARRHGVEPDADGQFRSVAVVEDGAVVLRAAAAARAMAHLPAPYRWVGRMLCALPVRVADALYDAVAARRHWVFRQTACWLPPPEQRARFLRS